MTHTHTHTRLTDVAALVSKVVDKTSMKLERRVSLKHECVGERYLSHILKHRVPARPVVPVVLYNSIDYIGLLV